jgi:hypothetical protein
VVKQAHSIGGHVDVILVEDETKVEFKIGWDSNSKCDNLIGFCGVKIHHHCVTNFIPIVGTREVGYNKILEVFINYIIVGFATIIIMNVLHFKLLRLVLVVFCTCNCFDAN